VYPNLVFYHFGFQLVSKSGSLPNPIRRPTIVVAVIIEFLELSEADDLMNNYSMGRRMIFTSLFLIFLCNDGVNVF
jgi:hypothetical protein